MSSITFSVATGKYDYGKVLELTVASGYSIEYSTGGEYSAYMGYLRLVDSCTISAYSVNNTTGVHGQTYTETYTVDAPILKCSLFPGTYNGPQSATMSTTGESYFYNVYTTLPTGSMDVFSFMECTYSKTITIKESCFLVLLTAIFGHIDMIVYDYIITADSEASTEITDDTISTYLNTVGSGGTTTTDTTTTTTDTTTTDSSGDLDYTTGGVADPFYKTTIDLSQWKVDPNNPSRYISINSTTVEYTSTDTTTVDLMANAAAEEAARIAAELENFNLSKEQITSIVTKHTKVELKALTADSKWTSNSTGSIYTGKFWQSKANLSVKNVNLAAGEIYEENAVYIDPITGYLQTLIDGELQEYIGEQLGYDTYPDYVKTNIIDSNETNVPFILDLPEATHYYYSEVTFDADLGYVEGSNIPTIITTGPFIITEPQVYNARLQSGSDYPSGFYGYVITAYTINNGIVYSTCIKFNLSNINTPYLGISVGFTGSENMPSFYDPNGPNGPWEPADAAVVYPAYINAPEGIGLIDNEIITDEYIWKPCLRTDVAEFFTDGTIFTTAVNLESSVKAVMIQWTYEIGYTIRGVVYKTYATKIVQVHGTTNETYAFNLAPAGNFTRNGDNMVMCTTATAGWIIAEIVDINPPPADITVTVVCDWWPGWYYLSSRVMYYTTAAKQAGHKVYVPVSGEVSWYSGTYISGCWLVGTSGGKIGDILQGVRND
jgi:hypothetical protein